MMLAKIFYGYGYNLIRFLKYFFLYGQPAVLFCLFFINPSRRLLWNRRSNFSEKWKSNTQRCYSNSGGIRYEELKMQLQSAGITDTWILSNDSLSEVKDIYAKSIARKLGIDHDLSFDEGISSIVNLGKTRYNWNLNQNLAQRYLDVFKEYESLIRNHFGDTRIFIHFGNWINAANVIDKSAMIKDALDYHVDLDGKKFIKLFILLFESKADDGAHHYVRKTHLSITPEFIALKRYDVADVELVYNNNIDKKFGEIGTCFFADTSALHRGTSSSKIRVMTNISFIAGPAPNFKDELFMLAPDSWAISKWSN